MTGILRLVPINAIGVPTRYKNTQQQHIVLGYGDRSHYSDIIGLPASAGLLAECWDEDVQAVSVVLQPWLPCDSLHPHIALSWVDGSAPVKANLMLEGEHQSIALESVMVPCMVEFIEWASPVRSTVWRDRALVKCKQTGCEKMVRSITGYCRNHRPATKYR